MPFSTRRLGCIVMVFFFFGQCGLMAAPDPSLTDHHPFPHNHTYAHGIRPSKFSQKQLNADVESMWEAWRSKYVTDKTCQPGELCVSTLYPGHAEGQAMLISVYIANPSNTGKSDFDALYRYYRRHERVENGTRYGLIEWKPGKNGGVAGDRFNADCDIHAAAALLMADKKWGSGGKIDYRSAALGIIDNLMKWCIDPDTFTWRGDKAIKIDEVRPLVNYYTLFAKASDDARWDKVIAAAYVPLDLVRNVTPDTPALRMPVAMSIKRVNVNSNASQVLFSTRKVPWEVGIDYLWHGTTNSPSAQYVPDRNADWFLHVTKGDPLNVFDTYTHQNRPETHAFMEHRGSVSSIAVSAMVSSSNQEWLDTLYAWVREQVPGESSNYEQTQVTKTGGGPFPEKVIRRKETGSSVPQFAAVARDATESSNVRVGAITLPRKWVRSTFQGDITMLSCMLVLTGNMPNPDQLKSPAER